MSQAVANKLQVDPKDLARILNIQVPVIVRLAEKEVPMREVLNMSIGSIIEFDKSVEDSLELMVNNKPTSLGEVVTIGEKFGLKVTDIGPVVETIAQLTGG